MTEQAVDLFERDAHRRAAATRVLDAEAVERRDPSAATNPIRWMAPGQAMVPEWDADQAVRFGYLANVVAFRCIQIIANTAASLAFRAGNPLEPDNHNPGARLAQLLGPPPGGPAKRLSARRLMAWTVAQRLATGRWAWEVETTERGGKGEIAALWPLVSANLSAVPSTSGSDWFSVFTYGPSHDPKRLVPDQVIYDWEPHPTDFRQPLSPLLASRYDLSIAVMSDRYSVSFLRNGAMPAAVVVTDQFPDDVSRNRFRRQWMARYQGPDRAGGVAFHEAGPGEGAVGDAIDVKVLGLSQKDARFVEQHQHSLQMVAISLGVPWSKLDASGRTFDNAGAEDVTFWTNTMLPLLTDLQDAINMQLAPRLGPEVGWFDLSGVEALKRRPGPVTQTVGVPALLQAQAMTINEARADYSLPPVDGGDRFLTVEEIQALKGTDQTTDVARFLAGIEARVVEHLGRLVPPPAPEPPAPPTRTRPSESRQLDADQLEQRRTQLWRRTDRAVTVLERRFERAFARLFERQADAVLRRLTGKRGRQMSQRGPDAASIFDFDYWSTQTGEASRDLYEAIMAAAGGRVADVFGFDFDLDAPYAGDFIDARANQLAGQVTDTTYQAIKDALAEGAAEGESIPDLAKRVRAVFDDAVGRRATVIARTETISAYNGSTVLVGAQLPAEVVAGQEWIATRDGRTRAAHAAADGQIVAVGSTFTVAGEALAYPGDPDGEATNTVQCRCAVALLTPDEFEEVTGAPPGRSRVPSTVARVALALVRAGESFDEARMRRALEVAA